jgi:hypothetical protein
VSYIPWLWRRLVRYLARRLELLYESLEEIARRLRESIARTVGEHVADAVREQVGHGPDRRAPRYAEPEYGHWGYDPPHDRAFDEDQDYDARWQDRSDLRSEEPTPQPFAGTSRWWALLPAWLRVLAWALHAAPGGRLLPLLATGVAAGGVTLLAGPLAGGLTAAVGLTLLMTGLADALRDAVGRLAVRLAG